jgi:hypothetical protein
MHISLQVEITKLKALTWRAHPPRIDGDDSSYSAANLEICPMQEFEVRGDRVNTSIMPITLDIYQAQKLS